MPNINLIRARVADPFYDVAGLTAQQHTCARLFAKGQHVTEIARTVGISRSAVYGHLNAAADQIGQRWGQAGVRAQDLPALAWNLVENEATA